LIRAPLDELQINLGYLCNQACEHCHIEAGPKRKEIMQWEIMERIVDWARRYNIRKADLTGGAPEMNPRFREFADRLLALGISIISRCNLTVLQEHGQEDLATWYAQRNIRLVCSLPCYTKQNVDSQRGKGAFGNSIAGLLQLNREGYGPDPAKIIDLVYNPGGPFLPPPQVALEADYRQRLRDDYDVEFNSLLTLTNLPINRFKHFLRRTGQLENYQQLLADSFNPDTLDPVMCRHLISVDWRGFVYDCDFNQILDIPCGATGCRLLWEIDPRRLEGQSITVGPHCFGCTAGAGSSCSGALV
ncbi:MAG: arsenosugar biosynthesis radical SAM (seleno)protein ArsS, partial [Pseudomonadota bacterium]|nr:arsenosugar biosynthesis radical SAM (seleno)protein ArsS [Pseudomonadota bacterium]